MRAGIVLAAGASERMGSPKALLAWGETTLLGYAIEQARNADITELVAVLGPATRHLQLDVKTVYNPEPDTGRSTSIRLAAAAIDDTASAIVVQSVDQPVPSDVLNALFQAVNNGAEVAIPTQGGRRGHPVCFAGHLLHELRRVTEHDQGLRAVVRAHAATTAEVPVSSESVLWNLNDPAAYAAVKP